MALLVSATNSPAAAYGDHGQDLAAATLPQVISNIRDWIVGILAGVATLFLTVGGLRYVMAGGDPSEVEKVKGALKSSAVGYALAVLAPALICVAASCCLLAGGLSLLAEVATSAPPTGITIASPSQVTVIFDTSVCPLQVVYDSMTPAAASSYAPLVAALAASGFWFQRTVCGPLAHERPRNHRLGGRLRGCVPRCLTPFPDQSATLNESYQDVADALTAFNAGAASAQGQADSAYRSTHTAAQEVGLSAEDLHGPLHSRLPSGILRCCSVDVMSVVNTGDADLKQIKTVKLLMNAAVVAMVAPLTACGGGSQAAANLTSSGAGLAGTSGTTASASASSATPVAPTSSTSVSMPPSTSATAGAGLPDLTLPSDVKLQFNLPKTGDPAKDAALRGLVQAEKAVYKATELGVDGGPLLDDFFVGQGPMMAGQYMSLKKNNGTTVTGTTVYYDWKITGGGADHHSYQVTYCQDQNKFFDKKRSTGQAVPQQSGVGQLISYKVDMVLDKDGRWKDDYYFWKSGDVACQVDGH